MRFLHAPPSLSLRVSYTNTSTAVSVLLSAIALSFAFSTTAGPATSSFSLGESVPIPPLPPKGFKAIFFAVGVPAKSVA